MGGLLHLIQRGRPEWAAAPPSPLLAVPNVTALLSTASVPITVLLYDGPWELKGTNSHMQKTGVNEHGSRFSAVDPLWPNSAECCCSDDRWHSVNIAILSVHLTVPVLYRNALKYYQFLQHVQGQI